jgi:hypothetical protein
MRALLLLLAACGDNLAVFDASNQSDAPPNVGSLFGEPCTQAPFPQIALCHDGLGACNDETAGSVCRPFCVFQGFEQCGVLNGKEVTTDRGACLCVPL